MLSLLGVRCQRLAARQGGLDLACPLCTLQIEAEAVPGHMAGFADPHSLRCIRLSFAGFSTFCLTFIIHQQRRSGSIESLEYDTNSAQGSGGGKLDLANLAKKFLLDQTLGALVNNAGFVIGITLIRGGSFADASAALNAVSQPMGNNSTPFQETSIV